MKNKFKTIIVGAGFGGLSAALKLGRSKKEVLIIDKNNHHLFQPLLYQVATAGLSATDIATPIREILKSYRSITVIKDELIDINKNEFYLTTKNNKKIEFENLVIATGAMYSYFGNDEWAKYSHGLKTLKDAVNIRENVLESFEKSEMADSDEEVEKLTTFVVIGGGPTGVEMAGAIAEIAKKTLVKNFSQVDPKKSKVYLIEGGDRILSSFHESLSLAAKKDLEKLGVEVILETHVEDISEEGVRYKGKLVRSKNIIWAAGNKASSIISKLDVETDEMGRAIVDGDCSIKNSPNIFVIGDAAAFKSGDNYLPSLAPVASQQGKYIASLISDSTPKGKRDNFEYFDKGTMATIGKKKAVMEVGKFKTSGFFAWVCWCFVHLLFLVLFRNRVAILSSWIYNYFTEKRGARLIK